MLQSNSTALEQQHTNPDKVRLVDKLDCELHGWKHLGVYPTVPHDINVRDRFGNEIYVMSVKWNRPIWIPDGHYTPVN
ncbi:hypothetical protein CAP35_13860 [Chitinophagaceae bacterium IBVUCB1]|nr:hypothetical protein CAP35_13860 [Chitinophagaceae bacterium IBVUCB1]